MNGQEDLLVRAHQALRQVVDPELGLNVVDLGLVDEIRPEANGVLRLRYRLTSPSCPVGSMIASGMREALEALPEVMGVTLEQLDEPWGVERMSPEGRLLMGL